MTARLRFQSRYVAPEDFIRIRKNADLTRKQAADLLDVAVRTVQNWETAGARIPWMAFRMLRILTGYALPGTAWQGWIVHGNRLYAPNGRWYEANTLEQIEQVFGMARLWRKDYQARCQVQQRIAALGITSGLDSGGVEKPTGKRMGIVKGQGKPRMRRPFPLTPRREVFGQPDTPNNSPAPLLTVISGGRS